jgi:hypothetical protein
MFGRSGPLLYICIYVHMYRSVLVMTSPVDLLATSHYCARSYRAIVGKIARTFLAHQLFSYREPSRLIADGGSNF